ncbi:MAG: transcription antitermination factor NusB [Bacteroidota bacterium]
MSSRREARERAMQALYAFELSGSDVQHVLRTVVRDQLDDPDLRTFAEQLFIRSIDATDEAEQLVVDHVRNWDVSRIALIDRLLLRMAICEFLAFEDIPPKVTINEIIEVAKKYSTPRSGQFINGILDAVLIDLKREGRLNKSGRGLIGMNALRD